MCNFTLVLQQQVLVQLVESPQLLEVVVVLQMLVQQQQVEQQEQIRQQIPDPDLGPVHHHCPLLALHRPLQSKDQQSASVQF